jgi:hypothetical protein
VTVPDREPLTAQTERVMQICRELLAIDVPMRALAPILAHVDADRCDDCGRIMASQEEWDDKTIEEGSRDDLCWGFGANCEAEYEGPL